MKRKEGRSLVVGPRASIVLLLAILAVAAGFRFYALGNGLPWVVGPDEGFEIHRALKLGAGEVDLERTAKGGFFYLLFVEYGAYFAWLRLTGAIDGAEQFAESFALDITPFWMIARVTHALTSLLAVLMIYLVGRRAYGELPGLLAAAATACSVLVVSRSHYVGVDLPMTLLVLVAFWLILDWADPKRPIRPFALGVVLGAATMTKLPAAILVCPIVVANALRYRGAARREMLVGRRVLTVYAVGLVVFALGNPGFVLGFADFVDKYSAVLSGRVSSAEEVFKEAGRGTNLWLYYARALRAALGWPLFALGLVGVGGALVRRRPADLTILAFVIPFYLVIAGAQTSHLYYTRYVLPLVPLVALLGGRVLSLGLDRISGGLGTRRVVATLAAGLLLLPAIAGSIRWSHRHGREDTRIYARRWLEGHVPEGSSVFLLGNPVVDTAPNLSLPLRASDENLDRLSGELREEGSLAKARILKLRKKSASGRPFDLHTVQHFEKVAPLDVWREAGVEYFALLEDDFGRDAVVGDAKHPGAVLESRLELYDALVQPGVSERVFAVDPEVDRLQGPAIEVFRLVGARP